MKKTLRPYQQAAFNAVIADESDKSLVVLPTGSGKSLLIAALANHYQGKIIVIQPALDLVEQNSKEFIEYTDNTCSICCASLGSKEHDQRVVFATIGSLKNHVYQDATIIIDEAHRLTPLLLGYITRCSPKKIIGLTATPFRLDIGYIFGEGKFFTEITYEALVSDLIEQNFLSNISVLDRNHSKFAYVIKDFDKTKELSDEEVDMAFIKSAATPHIVKDLLDQHHKRGGVLLIFAANVEHAYLIQSHIDEPSYVITHKTNTDDRIDQIEEVKLGEGVSILINVSTLTTGINIPNIRTIGLLRFTSSSTLVGQMIGRGLRKADGKADCLVVDYADNIDFHKIAPTTIITPNVNRIDSVDRSDNVKMTESDLEKAFPRSTIFYPRAIKQLKNHVEYKCTENKSLRIRIEDVPTVGKRLGWSVHKGQINVEFSAIPFVIVVRGRSEKMPRVTNIRSCEYVQFINHSDKSTYENSVKSAAMQPIIRRLVNLTRVVAPFVEDNKPLHVFSHWCRHFEKMDPNLAKPATANALHEKLSVVTNIHRRSLLKQRIATVMNIVSDNWGIYRVVVNNSYKPHDFATGASGMFVYDSVKDLHYFNTGIISVKHNQSISVVVDIENSEIVAHSVKKDAIASIEKHVRSHLYIASLADDSVFRKNSSEAIATDIFNRYVVLNRVGPIIPCSKTDWDDYAITQTLQTA